MINLESDTDRNLCLEYLMHLVKQLIMTVLGNFKSCICVETEDIYWKGIPFHPLHK